jgi:DNA-directed RNA polymerase specialized sigma24 family protein
LIQRVLFKRPITAKNFTIFAKFHDETELPDFQTEGEMKGSWKAEYGPSDWGDNPLKSLEESEFQSVLQKCISELPRNLAAIFTIREIEDWKTENI